MSTTKVTLLYRNISQGIKKWEVIRPDCIRFRSNGKEYKLVEVARDMSIRDKDNKIRKMEKEISRLKLKVSELEMLKLI